MQPRGYDHIMELNVDDRPPFFWDHLGWERHFATNLQAARERLRMSQYELAQRASQRGLKFHQTTLQRIESGRRAVKLSEAALLAELVGESLDSMMQSPSVPAMYRLVLNALDFEGVSDARETIKTLVVYIDGAGSNASTAWERYETSLNNADARSDEHLRSTTVRFVEECEQHSSVLSQAMDSLQKTSLERHGYLKGKGGPWKKDMEALWTSLARLERRSDGEH